MSSNPAREMARQRWGPRLSLEETARVVNESGLTDTQIAEIMGVAVFSAYRWRMGKSPAPAMLKELLELAPRRAV